MKPIFPHALLALAVFAFACHAQADTRLGAVSVSGKSGDTLEIPVGLLSTDSVSCVQFDLLYDAAQVTLGAARAGEAAPGHRVESNAVADGRERVVLFSTTLAPLGGGYVVKVPAAWKTEGRPTITVERISLATTSGASVTLTSQELTPQVVSVPTAPRVSRGGSTVLTVSVQGVGTVTYQWFLNGVAIDGATGATYTITAATSSNAGTYSVRVSSDGGTTTTQGFALTVTVPSKLINISTRAMVQDGDNVLIPGFVVRGNPGDTKQVLVRAVGPRLKDLGLNPAGLLADPVLELFQLRPGQSNLLVASNDDWVTNSDLPALHEVERKAGAFGLDGTADGGVVDTKSAVMVATLAPGNYTAVARGKNGGKGVAIVEVYEVNETDSSRLVNVSNRGYVGTGDQVMIPGFVVHGEEPSTFLIRAVGPGLSVFGFAPEGLLADPEVHVIQGGTPQVELAANDQWDATPEQKAAVENAQAKAGAFALTAGSADAALVVTLQPGVYTVTCSGRGGGTGTAIVEVYEVN